MRVAIHIAPDSPVSDCLSRVLIYRLLKNGERAKWPPLWPRDLDGHRIVSATEGDDCLILDLARPPRKRP